MKVQFQHSLQRAFNLLSRRTLIFLTVLLFSCRTVSYTIPQPLKMDLDKIKILSSSILSLYESKTQTQEDENTLILESVDKNKTTTEVLVAYRREGMNILEDIQLGKVIEHRIVVKNTKGEVLSNEPLELNNIKSIEFLSQSIEFDARKIPAVGEYITIHLELTYVMPYVDIGCEDSNTSCKRLGSLLTSANQDSSKDQTKEKVEADRSTIQSKIGTFNKDLSPLLSKSPGTSVTLTPPLTIGDVNVINYREWKLISSPTHFKILSILKNGKPSDDGKADGFELPELPTAVEAEKEKDKTFELEKEKPNLKSVPTKRRKKTIYLP